ncbi:MAG: ATP-binding protein [Erythrobacter sp.]|nr:ATP-binding protein [Erythrobacter sp.]MDZ4272699.1 ATP-binding protein [Erythrobacter sp.]
MDSGEPEAFPFIETTIARRMMMRMRQTHDERGITVINGPWGIGKTSAIDAFAREFESQCAIVKVEPGSNGRGLKSLRMLQLVIEALRVLNQRSVGSYPGTSPYLLRREVERLLSDWQYDHYGLEGPWPPTFTLIFDEAQYLSKEAIEQLRFWNDPDRCSMPFPVGLVFVGNNEFAMQETASGVSVLSGAVRSRLTFEVPLSYEDLSDTDMTLILQSRGVNDPAALTEFVSYFSQRRIKRDLRQVEKAIARCQRLADGGAITGQMARDILRPI